jgi:hypothetical protein
MMNGKPIPSMIHIKNDKAMQAFHIWDMDTKKVAY